MRHGHDRRDCHHRCGADAKANAGVPHRGHDAGRLGQQAGGACTGLQIRRDALVAEGRPGRWHLCARGGPLRIGHPCGLGRARRCGHRAHRFWHAGAVARGESDGRHGHRRCLWCGLGLHPGRWHGDAGCRRHPLRRLHRRALSLHGHRSAGDRHRAGPDGRCPAGGCGGRWHCHDGRRQRGRL